MLPRLIWRELRKGRGLGEWRERSRVLGSFELATDGLICLCRPGDPSAVATVELMTINRVGRLGNASGKKFCHDLLVVASMGHGASFLPDVVNLPHLATVLASDYSGARNVRRPLDCDSVASRGVILGGLRTSVILALMRVVLRGVGITGDFLALVILVRRIVGRHAI